MQPDRNLDHLFPDFRLKVQAIVSELNRFCSLHKPGFNAVLIEGFRTTARQQELYAQGRTTSGPKVTEKNGTTNPSNHQSCLAADIAPVDVHGNADWEDGKFFGYLAHLAHAYGLVSGADWVSFKDLDHCEWPTSDHGTYAEARLWKAKQGLK